MKSYLIPPYIKQEDWAQFQKEFTQKNFYRQLIRCPQTSSLTPEEKETIKDLQQRLWKDALSGLEELFEVDDYKKIPWEYTYAVYEFIKKHYHPSDTLIEEIRQKNHEISDIRIDDNISLKHSIENDEFFQEIKTRLHY